MAKKIITGLIAMVLSFEIVSVLIGYLLQPEYAFVQYMVSLLPLLLSLFLYFPLKELSYKADQALCSGVVVVLVLNAFNLIWIHNWGIYISIINFTLPVLSLLFYWLKQDMVHLKEEKNI